MSDEGYKVTALNDPELGLAYLEDSEVDVLITDMKMPKLTGREVLEHVKRNYSHIPVLIMTAFGSIEAAVEAMKVGAFDYITKPFANEEMLLSVSKAAQFARTQRENRLLRRQLEERFGLDRIVARGRAMKDVLEMVGKAGPSKSTVLITGESGTGKELIARAIHQASPRKDGPFISVNCMALNPGVLESELFGHEKGSFTGRGVPQARPLRDGGQGHPVFGRDRRADPGPPGQAATRGSRNAPLSAWAVPIPWRWTSASSPPPTRTWKARCPPGNTARTLFYRLNVVRIDLPPLRERREDIPVLASHFLHRFATENEKPVTGFDAGAMDYLTAYEWPGNVRQLENIVERCVVLAHEGEIGVEDLPPEIKDEDSQFKSAVDLLPAKLNLAETMDKIEGALVRRALVRSDFVQVKAAEMLGVSKSNLQYKLKKFKITGH